MADIDLTIDDAVSLSYADNTAITSIQRLAFEGLNSASTELGDLILTSDHKIEVDSMEVAVILSTFIVIGTGLGLVRRPKAQFKKRKSLIF